MRLSHTYQGTSPGLVSRHACAPEGCALGCLGYLVPVPESPAHRIPMLLFTRGVRVCSDTTT